MIIDPETKLIISLVVGPRTADTVVRVFTDFYDRTDGHLPALITSDAYAAYETVILDTYGVWWRQEMDLTPAEIADYERVGMPELYFPTEIAYATVHKERQGGRVVAVTQRLVLGTQEQVAQALEQGERSTTANTSFVERYHGTQRQFNARKKRKAYTFSKEASYHVACTWLVVLWYNFGWCVRTLREKVQEEPPRYLYRTPAMAAGLTDHNWSVSELLGYPLYPTQDIQPEGQVRTYKDVLERLAAATASAATG